MQKKVAKRLKGLFHDIEKKSEADKARLVLIWASLGVFAVFCLWLVGTSRNLARLGSASLDFSTLPAAPQLDTKAMGQALDGYTQISNAAWQEMGDQYLAQQKIMADDGFSSLKLSGMEEKEGAMLLTYQHYFKGLPVRGSELMLAVDSKSKNVTVKQDNLERGIELAADPQLPAKKAGEIALGAAGAGYDFSGAELVIVSYQGGYYLAWETTLKSSGGEEKKILVGAENGHVIPQENDDHQTSNMTE